MRTDPAGHPQPLGRRADAALARGLAALEHLQRRDGSWDAPAEWDPSFTAIHLLTCRYLDRVDPAEEEALTRYLSARQLASGGWAPSPDTPANLDISVLCYVALRASGVPADDPGLRQARAAIARLGGAGRIGVLGCVFLEMLGLIPAGSTPYVSPRIIAFPAWLHPNLHDLDRYAIGLVPVAVLLSLRDAAIRPLPAGRQIDELVPMNVRYRLRPIVFDGRRRASGGSPLRRGCIRAVCRGISVLGVVSRILDRILPPVACRSSALAWIAGQAGPDGTQTEIIHPTALALMSLDHSANPSHRRVVEAGLATLRTWIARAHGESWQQMCRSATHTTARVIEALIDGRSEDCGLAVQRGVRWLVDHRVSQRDITTGRSLQGRRLVAWGYGESGSSSPDADDTAIVLAAAPQALSREPGAVARAVDWLLSIQARNGGWAPYAAQSVSRWQVLLGWFLDLEGLSLRTEVDITARVLVALGPLRTASGDNLAIGRAVARGVEYLWRHRESNGCWPGRWVVNYAYGTAQALEALVACGFDADDPRLEQSVKWLESVQNADGGWGESKRSYATGRFEPGPSSPLVTAFVLRGLTAAHASAHSAAQRGLAYLIDHRDANGTWETSCWDAVLAPGLSYFRYDVVPTALAVSAMARIRRARAGAAVGVERSRCR